MDAIPVFREKRIVVNRKTGEIAVAEIKIWKVPRSIHYPKGRKFSLFLVSKGKTLIGIDNHRPKGPHRHIGEDEVTYGYVNEGRLLADFWGLVRKEGFEP